MPERVAPGRPLTGVSPIEVSREQPCLTAQTEAPEPRCITIKFRVEGSYIAVCQDGIQGMEKYLPSEEIEKRIAK